jgi:hypothetical protein
MRFEAIPRQDGPNKLAFRTCVLYTTQEFNPCSFSDGLALLSTKLHFSRPQCG